MKVATIMTASSPIDQSTFAPGIAIEGEGKLVNILHPDALDMTPSPKPPPAELPT